MATMKNLTVQANFFDGTLTAEFEKRGYPAVWKRGERRDLPDWLMRRVALSGGIVTIADDNAKESHIAQGAEPAQADLVEHWEKKFKKAKTVQVLFPEGFRDGSLAAELAAIGHPTEFGVGEIGDLPAELVEKIVRSGAVVERNPEAIAQFSQQQGKHQLKVRQWREEQERVAQRAEEHRKVTEHNKATLEAIEELSTQYIAATGKTKVALWQRMTELRKSLK